MGKNTSYTFVFWICLCIPLFQILSLLMDVKLDSLRIENSLWNISLEKLLQENWFSITFNLLCAFFGTFWIHNLNVQISWCEKESFYPSFVYALSLGIFFLSKDTSASLLCSVLWIEWFYILFTQYGRKDTSCSTAFNLSFLLSIISLIDISALFFYPFLFLGLWKMSVYSKKSILLSLMGLLLPLFYYGFISWFVRDTSCFIDYFQSIPNLIFWSWEEDYFWYIIYTISSFLFMGWISYLSHKGEIHSSLRIKRMLEYIAILILGASIFLLIGVKGKSSSVVVIHILFSMVVGRFLFSDKETPHKEMVFPAFIVLLLFLYMMAIWMF